MAGRTVRSHLGIVPITFLALAVVVLPRALPAQLWDARDRFVEPLADPNASFQNFGETVAACDWTGDGYDDLAIAAPFYGAGSGYVAFYHGGPSGTLTYFALMVGQTDEELGTALVCGDFDDDGTPGLAIGGPGFVFDAIAEGRVRFVDWNGSTLVEGTPLRQSLAGVSGEPEAGDSFGETLAVGDFDGDGVDDLAIGSPGEDVGALADAGAVTFFYGAAGVGIEIAGNTIWHKDVAGAGGVAAAGEEVGAALAAFDANCDSFVDLAIGIPFQTVTAVVDAGTVYVLQGSAAGLVATEVFQLDATDFSQSGASTPFEGDRFGAALASGGSYFGGSCGTLAIGAPRRQVGAIDNAGALYLIRLGFATSRYYTVIDFGAGADAGENLGAALALADFDADGRDDLAIGIPGNDPFLSPLFGGIWVLLSAGAEPVPGDARLIQPRSTLELVDFFVEDGDLGTSLAAGDFDGDGYADLAGGMPDGDSADFTNVGGVEVLFGGLFAADLEGGNDSEWSSTVP